MLKMIFLLSSSHAPYLSDYLCRLQSFFCFICIYINVMCLFMHIIYMTYRNVKQIYKKNIINIPVSLCIVKQKRGKLSITPLQIFIQNGFYYEKNISPQTAYFQLALRNPCRFYPVDYFMHYFTGSFCAWQRRPAGAI